ncbi:MAG: NTP transferase domain-containing protein, partial [Candidatus Marinimicrobia bacterium]|nr:NTP transferase domain-containing protein [Candidatus Neomarinimicrobiota bacterium]
MVKKLDTVILAAGLSTRMGAFKPLLPFKQSTIIETVIDTALAISNRVIVVVGFQATDIINVKRWDERVT